MEGNGRKRNEMEWNGMKWMTWNEMEWMYFCQDVTKWFRLKALNQWQLPLTISPTSTSTGGSQCRLLCTGAAHGGPTAVTVHYCRPANSQFKCCRRRKIEQVIRSSDVHLEGHRTLLSFHCGIGFDLRLWSESERIPLEFWLAQATAPLAAMNCLLPATPSVGRNSKRFQQEIAKFLILKTNQTWNWLLQAFLDTNITIPS